MRISTKKILQCSKIKKKVQIYKPAHGDTACCYSIIKQAMYSLLTQWNISINDTCRYQKYWYKVLVTKKSKSEDCIYTLITTS